MCLCVEDILSFLGGLCALLHFALLQDGLSDPVEPALSGVWPCCSGTHLDALSSSSSAIVRAQIPLEPCGQRFCLCGAVFTVTG